MIWQRAFIIGTLMALAVFCYGWFLQVSTLRVLVIRSLLTVVGITLVIMVTHRLIRMISEKQKNVSESLRSLSVEDLGELEEREPETMTEEDRDELKQRLEQEDEEGVKEIADLISDTIEE